MLIENVKTISSPIDIAQNAYLSLNSFPESQTQILSSVCKSVEGFKKILKVKKLTFEW